MLLKKWQPNTEAIEELNSILKSYKLSQRQKTLINIMITNIKKGIQGEKTAAYYIDYYLKDSKNWVVIHDLRIEFKGQIAQIDHLLINRLYDMYVIETKNFHAQYMEINDYGEFTLKYKNSKIGIPSPIEQNKRHIHLLDKILTNKDMYPRRFIRIKPKFLNVIMVSPNTIVKRSSKFDTSNIIKADMIMKFIEEKIDKMSITDTFSAIGKIASHEQLMNFGKKILMLHKPIKIDWLSYFGIKKEQKKKYFCARCKKDISEKEATYCWNHKSLFGGKAYCYDCQKFIKNAKI
ncbi:MULTISPECIES: nuclease-related domain-containing protein [unclassified Desulfurobacterium]|uniref:nuclease-related domain-containing protein n=1 Tax=Desulfurobacterium sp. TC5-1 TaxID=1158318 RepID=UPI0003B4EDF7|nr:nuclease-related domain-containing protein [Desulfurobacterium sp. TC5-1]